MSDIDKLLEENRKLIVRNNRLEEIIIVLDLCRTYLHQFATKTDEKEKNESGYMYNLLAAHLSSYKEASDIIANADEFISKLGEVIFGSQTVH